MICRPARLKARLPARPLRYTATSAASNGFFILESNPAARPDSTSPVPPTVIAGVDLGRLESSDIAIDDLGRVTLQLPAAEVFVATLDNDKSYVYDRDTGLLTRGDIQLEAEARRVAEAAILQAAIDDGILEQAQANAEVYLARLLLGLGHPEVQFWVAAGTPEPTLTLTPVPLPSGTP